MRKGRTLVAIVAYTVYCLLIYDLVSASHGTRALLAGAVLAFGVFAIITTRGISRWARKRFPQKKKS